MAAIDRGIGSEGLEQGGPNLGNDYSRKDLSTRNAGDALTTPDPVDTNKGSQGTLDMDQESSRNLSGEADDDLELDEDASIDELDDEDLLDDDDFDVDEDDEDEELDKGL
jgi:hypothetical protein